MMINSVTLFGVALLVVLLSSIAIASASVVPPTASSTLRALFVIHRHGSRTPIVHANASDLCPKNGGCGMLTAFGANMLNAFGSRVYDDYAPFGLRDLLTSEESAQGTCYVPSNVESRSTHFPRTVQSADAFLRGLTRSASSSAPQARCNSSHREQGGILPVVFNRPLDIDKELLVWTGWPTLVLWQVTNQKAFDAWANPMAEGIFASAGARLPILAREAVGDKLEGLCASQFFLCALTLRDLYVTAVASGGPNGASAAQYAGNLARYGPQFQALIEALNTYNMYNASRYFDRQTGTKGFYLAQEIIQEATERATSSTPQILFKEYSGHDSTIMPFAETLGNLSITNPQFGAAFIVEVWRETATTNVAVGPTVRVRYGQPTQTDAPPYVYDLRPFGLLCQRDGILDDGPIYSDGGNGCPLADWGRYVLRSRGPQSPLGTCFASREMLSEIDCLPGQSSSDMAGKPPTGACATFRKHCAGNACDFSDSRRSRPTFAIDRLLICRSVNGSRAEGASSDDRTDIKRHTLVVLVWSVAGTIVAIIVLLIVSRIVSRHCCKLRKAPMRHYRDEIINSNDDDEGAGSGGGPKYRPIEDTTQ